jgi:uncharacterized membrane protein YoaK (UPF0700 family)
MVLILAVMAGAMDAVDFHLYGVFTANQAANLVLFCVRLTSKAGEAALSLFSLTGFALPRRRPSGYNSSNRRQGVPAVTGSE